jgi:hypothetical protein
LATAQPVQSPVEEPLPVTVGDVVAGKYQVDRFLGRGGMGLVVAATHLQLGQRVAIKVLLPTANGEDVARFVREARAAVRLKSEHVTRVLDVGELPSGTPFMVMEYLEGGDLSERLERGSALPTAEAVDYLLQACEAIAEAHVSGIVHRDLKPSNLFLTHDAHGAAVVKVLDFGISKVDDPGGVSKLTQTTTVFGSPVYMSPEQMRSAHNVDARTDIWSLGIILFELLTKRTPFEAPTYAELVLNVSTADPPPIGQFRGDVPRALEAAIHRCLRKHPSERFPTLAELAAALAPHGSPDAKRMAERIARAYNAGSRAGGAETASRMIPAAQAVTAMPLPPSRSRWLVIGGAALAVAAITVLALTSLFPGRSRARADTPAAPEPAKTAPAAPMDQPRSTPTAQAAEARPPEVTPAATPEAPATVAPPVNRPAAPQPPRKADPPSAPATAAAPPPPAATPPPAAPPPAPQPPPKKNPLDMPLK